jgi:hypothetical protein
LNMKYLFWFSLQLLSETFLVPRRTERDTITNLYWSSCKVPVIFVRITENITCFTDFRKFSDTGFHEYPLSGTTRIVVPRERTDGRHTWRS